MYDFRVLPNLLDKGGKSAADSSVEAHSSPPWCLAEMRLNIACAGCGS